MKNEMNTLILGIGNDILMDDGIGPCLARHLRDEYGMEGVRYATACLGGLEILEFIQGCDTVVFIDAIKTKDGIPGSVYLYGTENFNETLHLSNLHDVSFLQALEIGRQLDLRIPERIFIIAVEIVEDSTFGTSFTPQLQEKYHSVLMNVNEMVNEILTEQTVANN